VRLKFRAAKLAAAQLCEPDRPERLIARAATFPGSHCASPHLNFVLERERRRGVEIQEQASGELSFVSADSTINTFRFEL
jgi:hypothetical protein